MRRLINKRSKADKLRDKIREGKIKIGNKWEPMSEDDISRIKAQIATLEANQKR